MPALLFRARDQFCALPLEHVAEIMRPYQLRPVAGAPDFALGVSLIRGAVVPVLDAGALLGITQVAAITRLVVLRLGERAVALAVEAVLGIRDIPQTSLQSLPPLLRNSEDALVAAISRLDRELLLVLRLGRTLVEPFENGVGGQV